MFLISITTKRVQIDGLFFYGFKLSQFLRLNYLTKYVLVCYLLHFHLEQFTLTVFSKISFLLLTVPETVNICSPVLDCSPKFPFPPHIYITSSLGSCCGHSFLLNSGVVAGGSGPPVKFLRGAKICNCQCEILYEICKVQLANNFKVVVILAFL